MWKQSEVRPNPGDGQDLVDIYAVGVLHTIITVWRCLFMPGIPARWTVMRREIRKERHYIWAYCIKQRKWRALKNCFNGYLAEHRHGLHNCGTGWTKNRAFRRSMKLCYENACMRFHPDEACIPGQNHPGVMV